MPPESKPLDTLDLIVCVLVDLILSDRLEEFCDKYLGEQGTKLTKKLKSTLVTSRKYRDNTPCLCPFASTFARYAGHPAWQICASVRVPLLHALYICYLAAPFAGY